MDLPVSAGAGGGRGERAEPALPSPACPKHEPLAPATSERLPAAAPTPPQVKLPFLKTLRGYLGGASWRILETLMQVGGGCG